MRTNKTSLDSLVTYAHTDEVLDTSALSIQRATAGEFDTVYDAWLCSNTVATYACGIVETGVNTNVIHVVIGPPAGGGLRDRIE